MINFFLSSIQKIFVRCRNVDELIGSSALYLLPYLLHLDVHFLRVKVDRSRDIGGGIKIIVEDSV